jgi:hypothetical protein
MNSKMYFNILREAWATGTSLVGFRPDAATGETMAHFADVPLVATDHISLDEEEEGTTSIYLVRVGQGAGDPHKIRGFSLMTSAKSPGIEIGSARPNDGSADEYFMEVGWDVGFMGGSRSSVVRGAGFLA